ncbi:MAG: hypothetical protein VX274_05595 [SAR324 cluster bacterium]|nr:hypothetical protein [SAR324 cluster bacterium]MEE3162809.1 hypothetical protein [SAR324 cluster bacterium]
MLFSAYQIESLLADFQQTDSPAGKSASETLSLSADAIQDARQYLRPLKRSPLNWVTPKDIRGLVEDISSYDPVVDNVQQSRAGRFVVPAYVPEIPAPAFPLVSDHTQMAPESETTEQESSESPVTEEDALMPEINTESAEVEDKVSVSVSEDISKENSLIIETEKSSEESEESTNGESAASLFEGIDDEEHELEEEGLQGDNSEENDVVFGDGRIDQKSMSNFVANYPDSTLKFLMRKNLDGRPLPVGYEEIYSQWENRGLSRGRLKKYLFKLMEWKNFPDIPVHDVVNKIREHQYFLEIK